MALTFGLFGQQLGYVFKPPTRREAPRSSQSPFQKITSCDGEGQGVKAEKPAEQTEDKEGGGVEEGEKAKKPAEQRGKNEEYRASPAPSGYGQSRGRRAFKKNRRKRSGKSGQARKGGLTQRYNPYGRPQSGNSGNVQMIPVVPWPVAEVCRGTESWVHNRAHFNSAGVGAEDCKNKTIKVPGLGELISQGTETQVHNTLQYSNSAGSRAEDGHYKFDFKIKVSANPESLGQIKETQVHNTVHSNSAGEGAEDCKNNITVPEELIGQGMETKEGIEIQVHNTAHSNNAGEGAEDCKNNITEPGEMIGQGIETKEGIETKMHNTVHSNSAGEGTEDDIGKNNIIAQAELIGQGTETKVHNTAHSNSAGEGAEDCKSNITVQTNLIGHGIETKEDIETKVHNTVGLGEGAEDCKNNITVQAELIGQGKETKVHSTVHSHSAEEGAEDCKNNITVPVEMTGLGIETREGIETQVHNTVHSHSAEEGAEDCKNNITVPVEMTGLGIDTIETKSKMHNTVHSHSAVEGAKDVQLKLDFKITVPADLESIGQVKETQVHNTVPSNRAENVLRMVSCAENGQLKITVPADPESLGQVTETEAHNTLLSQTSTSAEDCTEDGWHKITVLHGKKYDKELLTFLLKTMCPVPFQFTDFHYVKSRHMVFYVPDKATADDLQSLSRKIKTRNGKLVIVANPELPRSLQAMDQATMEAIKLCILKRFDAATSTLNLSNLYWDTELQAQDIHVVLNQKFYMNSVIAIIMEIVPVIDHLDISNNRLYNLNSLADLVPIREGVTSLNLSQNELKCVSELDKIKAWNLNMLWMNDNPLWNNYFEPSTYFRDVRKRFPNIVRLDGHVYSVPTES
ncbi:uncharacterized protein LOC144883079 isoform X2 [Branchiostoma floridae x Branchiostoma japonicum]